MAAKPKVVVLGGGFGGLEAAFYLRWKLGEQVDLHLVNNGEHFIFRPNTIYIPFGEPPEKFLIPLSKPASRQQIALTVGEVQAIDPDRRIVALSDGELPYDFLVVATGADMRPEEIPGLKEYAITPWTIDDMLRLRTALQQTVERARGGEHVRYVFLIPPNNRCSGPLYELVFMIDTWLSRQGVRENVQLTWTTMEEGYIQAFGPRLNTVVEEEFRERGIEGHKGWVVDHVEPGRVFYRNGERLDYDYLLAFPPYVAARRYELLPTDDRGFIQVEPDSRRVLGREREFAVGDTANFPIKQAFLALLQADAAADHIAAELSGKQPEVKFEPMSMCVMEEMNKATFAQVPLRYTGDPMKPVTVDTDHEEDYRVGVSPVWRLGKKVLGFYLPWRFSRGEPFHAGFAWEAMDLGLKVMSKVLAK